MKDPFKDLSEWFFKTSFEDILYANFKAGKEKVIDVIPQIPLIPPFKSREIEIYSNQDNYRFVNAFGKDTLFIKNLIYSLRLAYSKSFQEKSINKFYIFTDNEEKFECPSSFFVISTRKQDLYQKLSELRKQIMPEKPLPYTFYTQQNSTKVSSSCYEDSYKIQPKERRKNKFISLLFWLHEKFRL